MIEFSEYYKTLPTHELLEIIENPQNYQRAAVLAAQTEIELRHPTQEEMTSALSELDQKKHAAELQLRKKQERKQKNIETTKRALNKISPVKDGLTSGEKAVRRIVLIFCFFLLYWFISDFYRISIYFRTFPENPLESFLYLFPNAVIIIALFLFWQKKTSGWTLLCFSFIYISMPLILSLFDPWVWSTEKQDTLDIIFPRVSPIIYLAALLLFVGSLVMICRRDISEIFTVTKKKMATVIIISIIISLILEFFLIRW